MVLDPIPTYREPCFHDGTSLKVVDKIGINHDEELAGVVRPQVEADRSMFQLDTKSGVQRKPYEIGL